MMRKAPRSSFGRNLFSCCSLALLLTTSPALADVVLIDFGSSANDGGASVDSLSRQWNRIGSSNDLSGSPFALVNTSNSGSGWTISVSNPAGVTNPVGFTSVNTGGVAVANLNGDAASRSYPHFAVSDSLFSHVNTWSGAPPIEAVRLTISGLSALETYSLDFFASRLGGPNRETQYNIIGGNINTNLLLNAADNLGNIVGQAGITPDVNGQIIVDITAGPSNATGEEFYYLGALEINSTPVPEPGTWAMAAVVCGGGAWWWRRKREAA